MRPRDRCLLLAALAACGDDDGGAVCRGDVPVQVVATDNLAFTAWATASDTLVVLTDAFGPGDIRTLVGPDCGVPARDLADDVMFAPTRVQLDPADDDPDIVCDERRRRFHRIDPAGAAPPTPLLPDLDCTAVHPTGHGPVIAGVDGWWRIPDFPDAATAERLAVDAGPAEVVGERLIWTDVSTWTLRVHDLATGTDRALHGNAELLDATATHALWFERGADDLAPIHVHTLADADDRAIAAWRLGPDDYAAPYRVTPLPRWGFDPSGRWVVHVPFAADEPMQAFALDGARVDFPERGSPLLALADGTHVIVDGELVVAARPGSPAVALDWTYGERSRSAQVRGDALEVQMERDLLRVPLDGGPRVRIARDIGVRREWLDADHLVTIFEERLTTVHVAASVRRDHGPARSFVRVPGRGVYFNNVIRLGQPDNGVWFVPEAAARPQVSACASSYDCR